MVICNFCFYIFGICIWVVIDFSEIISCKLEWILVVVKYCCKGCNNCGVIICCYCGGGYKCFYCVVDFCCNKYGVFVKVVVIYYDLYCNVCLVLFFYVDGEKCYIFVFVGVQVGQIVVFGFDVLIENGNVMLLFLVFFGLVVYCVEFYVGCGGQMVCIVGVSVQVMVKEGDYVVLKLFFIEVCLVCCECYVIFGEVGNFEMCNISLGKVGCCCWFGCCFQV